MLYSSKLFIKRPSRIRTDRAPKCDILVEEKKFQKKTPHVYRKLLSPFESSWLSYTWWSPHIDEAYLFSISRLYFRVNERKCPRRFDWASNLPQKCVLVHCHKTKGDFESVGEEVPSRRNFPAIPKNDASYSSNFLEISPPIDSSSIYSRKFAGTLTIYILSFTDLTYGASHSKL